MKEFVVIVYQKDGTCHNHHVCTLKTAQQILKEWIKQEDTLCASIFTLLV